MAETHNPKGTEPTGDTAQSVVMTQYRCLMAGYATGDVTCWDIAWDALEAAFSTSIAKSLYGEFHHFVRTVRDGTKRRVGWRPTACRVLCRDECVILALLAVAQRSGAGAAEVAGRLVGPAHVEAVVAASRSLAKAVNAHGLVLPSPPCGIEFDWARSMAPSIH